MNNPNCYECIYRRAIPGDAHSRCVHPSLSKGDGDFMSSLVAMLTGENNEAVKLLNIIGDKHGIRSGWFLWPANFDPTWLNNCDGFVQKECHESKS